MAEIIEAINEKLREFQGHTEDLLGLVRDLGKIKQESEGIRRKIEEKLEEIKRCEEIIKNLKKDGEQVVLEIEKVSKRADETFRRFEYLENKINGVEQRADAVFQGITTKVDGFLEDRTKQYETKIDSALEMVRLHTEETRRILSQELTDFLNKQNALVANLTQQIDSCQRAIDVFRSDLEKISVTARSTREEIELLRQEMRNLGVSIESLRNENSELRRSTGAVREDLDELKAKFANTEFVKRIRLGWILTKREP